MRILVGTGDTAGITYELTKGFRSLRLKADSLIRGQNKFYKNTHTYTFNFSTISRWIEIDSIGNSLLRTGLKLIERLISFSGILLCMPLFIIRYTHIIIVSVDSTLLYRLDLPVLNFLGKKLEFFCVGSDVRHLSAFHQEVGGDLSTWEEVFKKRDINWNIRNIREAESYGNTIFSVPDQSGLALRPYYHAQLPIDVSRYKFEIQENEIPKILHAPSRTGAKGTDRILATLDQLKADGYQFSCILLKGVPNQVVLDSLTSADILIDEIYAHGPSKLAFEAMASGCAVANRFYKGSFQNALPPICHIDENNLFEPIKKLITDKAYRQQLAKEGRAYVETYQTKEVVAQRMLAIIKQGGPYDYYPTFFLRKYRLPSGSVVKSRYLHLGKKIILEYGAASIDDVRRGIKEKLIASFTEEELARVKLWN